MATVTNRVTASKYLNKQNSEQLNRYSKEMPSLQIMEKLDEMRRVATLVMNIVAARVSKSVDTRIAKNVTSRITKIQAQRSAH